MSPSRRQLLLRLQLDQNLGVFWLQSDRLQIVRQSLRLVAQLGVVKLGRLKQKLQLHVGIDIVSKLHVNRVDESLGVV